MGALKRLAGWVVVLAALPAGAAQRTAVLEFFGRPAGEYCSAAGPAMIALQREYAGRAVLLEYDYDDFSRGRVDRFWVANPTARVLPLVMVGSGFVTSTGKVDYLAEYRRMLEAELARPAGAGLEVYWRRAGSSVRGYIRVTAGEGVPLTTGDAAAVWLVVWENDRIGVSDTWVRAATYRPLAASLAPGAAVDLVIDSPSLSGVDWGDLACLALVERRPGGSGVYDTVHAAVAASAGLTAAPQALALSPVARSGDVQLAGPPVLAWTADTDVDWLTVEPATGRAPATARLAVDLARAPAGSASGTVRFTASGEGISSTAEVQVAWAGRTRAPRRLVRGSGNGSN